jgi:hypothetical protein
MLMRLLVTVGGIGLIVWVNWYFLFSKKNDMSSPGRKKTD